MPELTRILTDDQGTITHVVTDEEERLSVEDLAMEIDKGREFYVAFGEDEHYPVTVMAEDGRLQPTVDDPDGIRTIADLPQEEDPAESEIVEMFDEMGRMGEFDDEADGLIHDDQEGEMDADDMRVI